MFESFNYVQQQRSIVRPSPHHLLQLLKFQSFLFYQDANFRAKLFTVEKHIPDNQLMNTVVQNLISSIKLGLPRTSNTSQDLIQKTLVKFWSPNVQQDPKTEQKYVLIPSAEQFDSIIAELL